jgi:hypothetical protein
MQNIAPGFHRRRSPASVAVDERGLKMGRFYELNG